jgi:hypothetical protein
MASKTTAPGNARNSKCNERMSLGSLPHDRASARSVLMGHRCRGSAPRTDRRHGEPAYWGRASSTNWLSGPFHLTNGRYCLAGKRGVRDSQMNAGIRRCGDRHNLRLVAVYRIPGIRPESLRDWDGRPPASKLVQQYVVPALGVPRLSSVLKPRSLRGRSSSPKK